MYNQLAILNAISKLFLKLLIDMPYGNSIIIIMNEIHNFLVAQFLIITRELPLSALEIIAPFLSSFYSILFMIFSLCQEMHFKCYIFSYCLYRLLYYFHPDISYALVQIRVID